MIAPAPNFSPRNVLDRQMRLPGDEPEVGGREALSHQALVVDDEEPILEIVRAILERKLGLKVTVAHNGSEAVEQVRHHAYDLIICDVRMPVMSGPEFFAWLLRQCPAQARRTLFLTGDYGSALDEAVLRESHAPVLPKPFTMDTLLEQCRRLMRSTPSAKTSV